MSTNARTAVTFAAIGLVVIAGLYVSMRGAPEPAATPTPTPLSPPPFEQGSPAGALHAYLEGDFAGERLERATWATKYAHLVVWGAEPKWDGAYVIRSFRVESGPRQAHKASAEATFDTMGELDLDHFTYTPSATRQRVPYDLVMGNDGWLIASPTLRPHVGPEAAISYLKRMEVGYSRLAKTINKAIAQIDADARAAKP